MFLFVTRSFESGRQRSWKHFQISGLEGKRQVDIIRLHRRGGGSVPPPPPRPVPSLRCPWKLGDCPGLSIKQMLLYLEKISKNRGPMLLDFQALKSCTILPTSPHNPSREARVGWLFAPGAGPGARGQTCDSGTWEVGLLGSGQEGSCRCFSPGPTETQV